MTPRCCSTPETLEYLELDDTAAAMWRAISSTETAEAALDQLPRALTRPRDVVAADLQRLADWLVEAGYLMAAGAPSATEIPRPTAPSNTGDGALVARLRRTQRRLHRTPHALPCAA